MKQIALLNEQEVGLPLKWKPVDQQRCKRVHLFGVWAHLEKKGFDAGLISRIKRFVSIAHEEGNFEFVRGPLEVFGESFLPENRFDHSAYDLCGKSSDGFDRHKWVAAIEEIATYLGKNFPATLWNTIAALGLRDNPTVEDSILNVEGLPYPWGVCDAAMHSMLKSTALSDHVRGELSRMTGFTLHHGCGCNHMLDPAEEGGEFRARKIEGERMKFKAAKEQFDHFLSEIHLIFVTGFPFRMNPEDFQSQRVISIRPS